MWDATNMTGDNKKIAQFVGMLRKRALTWYIILLKSSKNEGWNKKNYLAFFKTEDVAHIAAQKLKEIK